VHPSLDGMASLFLLQMLERSRACDAHNIYPDHKDSFQIMGKNMLVVIHHFQIHSTAMVLLWHWDTVMEIDLTEDSQTHSCAS